MLFPSHYIFFLMIFSWVQALTTRPVMCWWPWRSSLLTSHREFTLIGWKAILELETRLSGLLNSDFERQNLFTFNETAGRKPWDTESSEFVCRCKRGVRSRGLVTPSRVVWTGSDVWIRHRWDGGVHAPHHRPRPQAQRKDGRIETKWDCPLVPSWLQDTGREITQNPNQHRTDDETKGKVNPILFQKLVVFKSLSQYSLTDHERSKSRFSGGPDQIFQYSLFFFTLSSCSDTQWGEYGKPLRSKFNFSSLTFSDSQSANICTII